LTNPDDQAAWSCDLVGSEQIWINIETTKAGSGNTTGAYLYTQAGDDPSKQLSYGMQVSNMVTTFAPFWYVTDLDDPEDGHAFYFQQDYNKLVVVPEGAIDYSSRKMKRDAYGNLPGWLVQKQYATPGDRPWFCYWNNTLLEAFIYKSQPAVIAPTPTSSSASSTITPPPSSKSTSTPASTPASSQTVSWTISGVDPWSTVTTVVTMPTTSCTYTGVASEFGGWMHSYYPDYEHYVKGGPGGSGAPSQSKGNSKVKRDDDANYNDADDSPVFEYLVKVEERRQPHSPAPMCVQYMVLQNYAWNVITENGVEVTITLEESDPPLSSYHSKSRPRLRSRNTAPAGSCHCQWMSGEG
jgi:hypothetical protein